MASAGWRTIGGQKHYFRSLCEIRYALWLQYQKEREWIYDWDYEPKTFWFEGIKRGCVSYKPDFQVFLTAKTWCWIEVKGWMDPRSITKIKRFRKYFPEEELRVIDKEFFKTNNAKLRCILPDWEVGNSQSASRHYQSRRSQRAS